MIGQTVADPSFTLGIEEEYLLVDRDSLALAEAPENLVEECLSEMEGQVSPEFLQCQIEVGTKVCANIGQAREDLKRLRDCVSRHAANHNLAPIAASCHPSAEWRAQHHTDKERYNDLEKALGGVARRLLICGMHVHVGLESDALRVDQLPQMSYFLPHLLALSVSSPFWQGEDSKLASYRLTIFDNLPRTGLPPTFNSWAEYERTAGALIDLDIIEDTTKIWWDLRPSHRFPTLETRICDVSPRMEDTLSIAALVQCLHRMLWRLRLGNQRWRQYDRFLIAENRWRAQRYGITEGLIDFGRQEIVPMAELVAELQAMLAEDAEILGCSEALSGLDRIIAGGTSAQRQRAVFNDAVDRGEDRSGAADQVVKTLVKEFHADL